jgi:hypothetical protein
MATAKLPDTLAASLRHQHKRIDEMRASARMRARLMKKIPRRVEFPPGLVEKMNPGPRRSSALLGGATEPPLPSDDNPCGWTYSTE